MACADPNVDLESIPLSALNVTVRKKLGLYLNPRNAVASDWMSVAEEMDFSYREIQNYVETKNPTAMVLDDWQARSTDATVGKLLSILKKVDRNDVVEDLQVYIGAFRGIWKFKFPLILLFICLFILFLAHFSLKTISLHLQLYFHSTFCVFQEVTQMSVSGRNP